MSVLDGAHILRCRSFLRHRLMAVSFVFGPIPGETLGEYLERIQKPDAVDGLLKGRIVYRQPTADCIDTRQHRSFWLRLQRDHWNRTDLRPALRQDTDQILRRCKAQELTAAEAHEQIEDAIRLDRVTANYQFTEQELADIIESMKVIA